MPSTSTPRSRARDDTEEWIVDFGIFAHYCYGYILFIGAKITKNIETAKYPMLFLRKKAPICPDSHYFAPFA